MIKHCHICYTIDESKIEDWSICDMCECIYCSDCSYTFSLHYQFQGSRCYLCADQSRRVFLSRSDKRNNKITFVQKLE